LGACFGIATKSLPELAGDVLYQRLVLGSGRNGRPISSSQVSIHQQSPLLLALVAAIESGDNDTAADRSRLAGVKPMTGEWYAIKYRPAGSTIGFFDWSDTFPTQQEAVEFTDVIAAILGYPIEADIYHEILLPEVIGNA
jgi:hypothetical protein